MKPKPRWFPEPAAFFGRRTVFNSPNVLKGRTEQIISLLNDLDPKVLHTLQIINSFVHVTLTRRVPEFP